MACDIFQKRQRDYCVERDIVLMSQNGGLRNWWAPPRSGIWGPPVLAPLMFADLI